MSLLKAKDFEKEVHSWFNNIDKKVISFETKHRDKLKGVDGEYEIDITIRFEFLGAVFLVLVECKHHINPIKRETVQILNDKIKSAGAQKGIMVTTSTYQVGAIEYANKHGIALIKYISGKDYWIIRKQEIILEKQNSNANLYSGWFIINDVIPEYDPTKHLNEKVLGLKVFLFDKD